MAILMEESYWRNSQLSIAWFYGEINVRGGFSDDGKCHRMVIVNKEGVTLMELFDPDSKHYVVDGMAIKPGEPADLVDEDFVRYYKKLGRERFVSILISNWTASRNRLHKLYKEAVSAVEK